MPLVTSPISAVRTLEDAGRRPSRRPCFPGAVTFSSLPIDWVPVSVAKTASKAEGEARGETLIPFPSNCVFIDLVSHPFSSQDSAARMPSACRLDPGARRAAGGTVPLEEGAFR